MAKCIVDVVLNKNGLEPSKLYKALVETYGTKDAIKIFNHLSTKKFAKLYGSEITEDPIFVKESAEVIIQTGNGTLHSQIKASSLIVTDAVLKEDANKPFNNFTLNDLISWKSKVRESRLFEIPTNISFKEQELIKSKFANQHKAYREDDYVSFAVRTKDEHPEYKTPQLADLYNSYKYNQFNALINDIYSYLKERIKVVEVSPVSNEVIPDKFRDTKWTESSMQAASKEHDKSISDEPTIKTKTLLPVPNSINSSFNLTDKELKYAINIANTIFINSKSDLLVLTNKDAKSGTTIRNKVGNLLAAQAKKAYENKAINLDQAKVNVKIAKEILNNELLWDKIKLYAINNLGIVINESEVGTEIVEEDDVVSKTFDDRSQLKETPDMRISADIKRLICSTIKLSSNNYTTVNNKVVYVNNQSDVDNPGGLPLMLDFNMAYRHLTQNLYNSKSVTDLKTRIKFLADSVDPSYNSILDTLNSNSDLANLFFNNFKSAASSKLQMTLKDENTNEVKNLKVENIALNGMASRQLGNQWINTFASRYAIHFFDQYKAELNKLRLIVDQPIVKATSATDLIANATAAERIFEIFGMDISADNIIRFCTDSNPIPQDVNESDLISGDASHEAKSFSVISTTIDFLIEHYINGTGLKSKNGVTKFNDRKKINTLAKHLKHLYYADTLSYMNGNGDTESAFNKPSYITDLFETLSSPQGSDKLERLSDMAKVPEFQHSNWLLANPLGENMLEKRGKTIELNKNVNIYLHEFESLTYLGKNKNYTQLKNDEFERTKILFYKHFSKSNYSMFFVPSPADRGRIHTIYAPSINTAGEDLFRANDKGQYVINRANSLYKGVKNVFLQEVYRIDQDLKAIMTPDNVLRSDFDGLIENYHYKVINGVSTFTDQEGKLLGSAFKFYTFINSKRDANKAFAISATNNFAEGILSIKTDDGKLVDNNITNSFIDQFLKDIVNEERTAILKHKAILGKDMTEFEITTFAANYGLNYFIFNKEYSNFVQGGVEWYGSSDKANKRNNGPSSPGIPNGNYGTKATYNHVTIEDLLVQSKTHLKHIKATISALENKGQISKKNKDLLIRAYTKTINTADAQSYITLNEFKRRLHDQGTYSKYAEVIARIEKGTFNNTDLDSFIELQKNYYMGYEYNGTINKMIPTIVKNSEFVLIPGIIAGTELEVLNNEMNHPELNISQLSFQSAVKVGAWRIAKIFKDGKLNTKVLHSELKKSIQPLYYKNLRKQLDIVSHIEDTNNKLGARVIAKILDNVTDPDIISIVDDVRVSKIKRHYTRLINELTVDKDVDNEALRGIIYKSIIEGGNSNDIDAIAIDELTGLFNLPLDFSLHRKKIISKVLSIFNNNVSRQTLPGIHGPQLSNAMMGQPTKPKLSSETPKGILRKLSYSYFKDGDSNFITAEVLLPAWSKQFFNRKDKDGNVMPVTIEELKAAGLDTMIGYRHPTEDKHSYFVFSVVGFLDKSQGSSIIVPPEVVTQMGSDFDIDTLYTMNYHMTSVSGVLSKVELLTDENSTIEDRYIKYVNSEVDSKLRTKISKEVFNEYKSISDEAYNSLKAERKALNKDIYNLYDYIRSQVSALEDTKLNRIGSKLDSNYDFNNLDRTLGILNELKSYSESLVETIHLLKDSKTTKNTKEANLLKDKVIKINNLISSVEDITSELHNDDTTLQDKYDSFKLSNVEFWSNLQLAKAVNIADAAKLVTLEDFANLSIYDQNTEEALDNLMIDQFYKVLTDVNHFIENSTPNTTEDMELGRDLVDSLRNKIESAVSYYLNSSQISYRTKNVNGRDLKAQSINRDTFISFAQKSKLELESAIYIKYAAVSKNLKDYYANRHLDNNDSRCVDATKNIYKLSQFGSITNTIGALTTSYCAQTTANILDNVAIRLSDNFGKAFGVFRVLLELGADMNIANLLIHQPSVTRLLNQEQEFKLAYNSKTGNAYTIVYNELLKKLIPYFYNSKSATKGSIFTTDQFNKYEEIINSKGAKDNLYFTNYQIGKVLKALNESKLLNNVIDESELIDNINNENVTKESVLSSIKSVRIYQNLQEISKDIDLVISKFNHDRTGLTKSFSNFERVGSEVFTKLKLTPADIYSKDPNDSVSKPLRAFYKYSNLASYKLFSPLFLENNKHVASFIKTYEFDDNVMNDVVAYNLRNNPVLASIDVRTLLNIKNTYTNVDVNDINNLKEFSELSVIEQTVILQNEYKHRLPKDHLLFKLLPVTTDEYVATTGYPGVLFEIYGSVESYIDDFRSMFYSANNPFFHVFATNLIKFAYLNNGFVYGKNLSKVIPTEILANAYRIVDNINGVDILSGIGISDTYYKNKNDHEASNFVNPYTLKYAIDYSRRNYKVNSVVPNANNTKWTPNKELGGMILIDNKEFRSQPYDIRKATVIKFENYKQNLTTLYAKIPVLTYRTEHTVHGVQEIEDMLFYYVPLNKLGKFEFTDNSQIPFDNTTFPIDHYMDLIRLDIRSKELRTESSRPELQIGYSGLDEYYHNTEYESESPIAGRSNPLINRTYWQDEFIVDDEKYHVTPIDPVTKEWLSEPAIYDAYGNLLSTKLNSKGFPISEKARQVLTNYYWRSTFNESERTDKVLTRFMEDQANIADQTMANSLGIELQDNIIVSKRGELIAINGQFNMRNLLSLSNEWTIDNIKSALINTVNQFNIGLSAEQKIVINTDLNYMNFDEIRNEFNILANKIKC